MSKLPHPDWLPPDIDLETHLGTMNDYIVAQTMLNGAFLKLLQEMAPGHGRAMLASYRKESERLQIARDSRPAERSVARIVVEALEEAFEDEAPGGGLNSRVAAQQVAINTLLEIVRDLAPEKAEQALLNARSFWLSHRDDKDRADTAKHYLEIFENALGDAEENILPDQEGDLP